MFRSGWYQALLNLKPIPSNRHSPLLLHCAGVSTHLNTHKKQLKDSQQRVSSPKKAYQVTCVSLVQPCEVHCILTSHHESFYCPSNLGPSCWVYVSYKVAVLIASTTGGYSKLGRSSLTPRTTSDRVRGPDILQSRSRCPASPTCVWRFPSRGEAREEAIWHASTPNRINTSMPFRLREAFSCRFQPARLIRTWVTRA